MTPQLERIKKHLLTAMVIGLENQLDTAEKIFLEELGEVPEEVERSMIVVIKSLRALLD